MNRKGIVTAIVCALMVLVAYFAWQFVFFEYETNVYTTTAEQLFTLDHLAKLAPLLIIGLLTAIGIIACVAVRNYLMRHDTLRGPYAAWRVPFPKGHVRGRRVSAFMVVRWTCMVGFFVLMVFVGVLLGVRYSWISVPVFSCPANMSQLTEASCYYLAHLEELAGLPLMGILAFVASTLVPCSAKSACRYSDLTRSTAS